MTDYEGLFNDVKEKRYLHRRISTKMTCIEVKKSFADDVRLGIDVDRNVNVIILTNPFSASNGFSYASSLLSSSEALQRQVIRSIMMIRTGSAVDRDNFESRLLSGLLGNDDDFGRCDLVMEACPKMLVYFIFCNGSGKPSIFDFDCCEMMYDVFDDLQSTFDNLSSFKLYVKYFDDIEKSIIYRKINEKLYRDNPVDPENISSRINDVRDISRIYKGEIETLLKKMDSMRFKKVYIMKRVD